MLRSCLVVCVVLAAGCQGPEWFVNGRSRGMGSETVAAAPAPVAEPAQAAEPAPALAAPVAAAPVVDPCAAGQQHTPDQCPTLDDDGDGVANGIDRCPDEAGTAEHYGCQAPRSAAVEKDAGGTRRIVIREAVYFDTGKATIQSRSFKVLDDVTAVLKENADIAKVVVGGHTDSAGADKLNQALSAARAAAVRAYLVDQGIEPDRVEARGFGATRPVADNRTRAGREKNRRVEFVIP